MAVMRAVLKAATMAVKMPINMMPIKRAVMMCKNVSSN
jgi:hypothetical protein